VKNQNTQLKAADPRITSTSAGLLIQLNTYRVAVFALLLAGATLLSTSAASAATITVINTNDSGPGSLRQALVDANDGDTINFDSSLKGQTITLTSGQLNVDKNVTISGPGAKHLAVDGNAQSRVFYVNPFKTVTIDGLTVENGYSDFGGGIHNDSSVLTVSNSTISGNSASSSGGGIVNGGFRPTLTITNSTVSGNSASSSGGGIVNANTGGILNSATLTITNSTVSGNSASFGGGIYNSASDFQGGSTLLIVSNSTLSGNSADSGGGIYNYYGGLYSSDSILNAGASGENIYNYYGPVTSLGYNLSSDDGGGYLTGPGDQINTDPMLGPLEDNGGPTFTHALLPRSPAIDAGNPNFTPPPLYDQRGSGFDRVVNGRIDIGSFEVQGPTPTPTPTPTATATPTPTPTSTPRPTPTPRQRPTPQPRLIPPQ
jgi:hypothetical protein